MKILPQIKHIDRLLLRKRFLLLILFTPLFWHLVLSPISIAEVWTLYPLSFKTKITSLFSEDKLVTINEMRWDSFADDKNDISSKMFYNKAMLMAGELFDYFSYLSPNLYFQAGDGSNFSPSGVEPISAILFPFWIVGIFKISKSKRSKKITKIILASSFIAFLGSQKNFAFLFPVAAVYVYLAFLGIEKIFSRGKMRMYRMCQIYGLYIILRSFYILLI